MPQIDIKKAEERYNVKYVGYYDIPGKDDKIIEGVYVFYTPTPDTSKGHGNYLGIMFQRYGLDDWNKDQIWLINAKNIEKAKYPAIKVSSKKYLCSRYVHDYQTEGSAFIDGGLFYTRLNPMYPITHHMQVVNGVETFIKVEKDD